MTKDIYAASEPSPAVRHDVELEVREVVEELVLALELVEEEQQEAAEAAQVASTPATLKSSTKRAVRWNDQIAAVKHYEVTVEERRYKRSLLEYMESKGPAPWAPVRSVPSRRPQRTDDQVMMPRC